MYLKGKKINDKQTTGKKEIWQFPKNKLIITNEVINFFLLTLKKIKLAMQVLINTVIIYHNVKWEIFAPH